MSTRTKTLTKWQEEETIVAVFLLSGIRLIGRIADFDETTIYFKNSEQLIFMQGISTIQPEATTRH